MKSITDGAGFAFLSTDKEGLMARKMEELAYEAVNKVYAKDDTGPYDCLRYVSLRGFSKDSMWLPGSGGGDSSHTHAILSPHGMHLSVYSCTYQLTPRVFSWGTLQ